MAAVSDRIKLRAAGGAAARGVLITLAGWTCAVVLVIVVGYSAPRFAASPTFFWLSAIVGVVLLAAVGLLSGRSAARRLPEAGLEQPLTLGSLAAIGPVLFALIGTVPMAINGYPIGLPIAVGAVLAGTTVGTVLGRG
jgi:hypothetical protein